MASDYDRFHTNPVNLLIHIVAVPFFVVGVLLALWCLASGQVLAGALWLLVPGLSLALQGIGHKREALPPEPFRGALDFVRRIFLEQFYRFWVFVFSGGWSRNLRARQESHGT